MLAGATTATCNLTKREVEAQMRHYEGLIFSTARRLVASGVEQEMEDIQQQLRLKVWKGVMAFNPAKARGMTQDKYVFMVLRDLAKDIAKKKRRGELYIDDIAPNAGSNSNGNSNGAGPRDKFDERYLSQDHDSTYGEVEDELPTLPNTLSEREREVMALMAQDYRQTEIAGMLEVTKREVESAVRSLRIKLADWHPSCS